MSPTLQQQLNILDYSLTTIYQKKWRNLSVFLVFSTVVFLLASFLFLASTLTRTAEYLLEMVPDITVQQLQAGRQIPLSADAPSGLRSVFGISDIRARVWGYYFDESNGANYTVIGMDNVGNSYPVNLLANGSFPESAAAGQVVVGTGVYDSLDLAGRKHFSFFRPDLGQKSLHVTGVFKDSANLLATDLILMSMPDAQDLFGMDDNEVTDLLVNVANPEEIPTIAAKIAAAIPGSRVVTAGQIKKTYQAVFSFRSGFGSACLLAALAAFIVLAFDKALGFSAEDKRESGILKMLGWQTSDIMRVRFYESAVISFLAFISGATLAWSHILFFQGGMFRPVFLGWSVLRPSFELVPYIQGRDVMLLFSFSVLPYLVATVIPAWRSSIVRADSVV